MSVGAICSLRNQFNKMKEKTKKIARELAIYDKLIVKSAVKVSFSSQLDGVLKL